MWRKQRDDEMTHAREDLEDHRTAVVVARLEMAVKHFENQIVKLDDVVDKAEDVISEVIDDDDSEGTE